VAQTRKASLANCDRIFENHAAAYKKVAVGVGPQKGCRKKERIGSVGLVLAPRLRDRSTKGGSVQWKYNKSKFEAKLPRRSKINLVLKNESK
jgi:hypothetical protein